MQRYAFKLPDLGEGVVEGEIVAWHVQPGDDVEEDQPLLDVMTDKATVTLPSVVAGRVVATHGRIGEMVPVGTELVEMERRPEVPASLALVRVDAPSNGGRSLPRAKRPEVGPTQLASASTDALPRRPLASPAVRRRAREKGVDLRMVTGTGRSGRITDADIERFLKQGTTPPNGRSQRSNNTPQNHAGSPPRSENDGARRSFGTGSNNGLQNHAGSSPRSENDGVRRSFGTGAKRTGITEIHISGLRRSIARKMAVSHTQIPHFSYIEQVDLTELARLRRHLNEGRSGDTPKLTYLPFIMLALVKAFRQHPAANAHYDDRREVVTRFEAAHLGIATQTEQGLYVPVVRHVEAMDLWDAARELRRVTQAVHHDTITRDELIGSTFTITSLGVLGGLAATPIINHPEVGILGIHKATDRPVVENGQIVIRHMVNLSASFDHRIVDGAEGAALIQTLKGYLEHPATIFL
ncbi:MAG: dihydrolipoamide acetyltransferase family protein [Pirellulales bacterium]